MHQFNLSLNVFFLIHLKYRHLVFAVVDTDPANWYKKLIRRWNNERELSIRRHRTPTTLYNRLVHKFRQISTRWLRVKKYVHQIQWNNALRRSRSFKITDFGTNRKPMYDFLIVINTNLRPIFSLFQYSAPSHGGLTHSSQVSRTVSKLFDSSNFR